MSEESIRLLLVDDHVSYRELLALRLAREPDLEVVGEAGTLAEARRVLDGIEADVALVDLILPDGGGVDLIRQLRAANPVAIVLVLTASDERLHHAVAVAAGAVGVLHKAASTDEIIAAIRRACKGEPLLSPREAVDLLRLVDRQRTAEREAAETASRLTARDRDLLALLAEGLGDEAIAERLFLQPKTVRNQMVGLLAKLGVESRLQALVLAVRLGVVRID